MPEVSQVHADLSQSKMVYPYCCDIREGHLLCPVCLSELDRVLSSVIYQCPNADCAFRTHEATQEVVRGLMEQGSDVLTACSLALQFTFESEPAGLTPRGFAVTDQRSADWVLKKIAQAQAAIEGIDEMERAETEPIKRRCESLRDQHRRTIQFMTMAYGDQLKAFAAVKLAEDGKKKSVDLIYGRLRFQKQRGRTEIDDEPGLISFSKHFGFPGIVKESVEVGEARRLYDALHDAESEEFGHLSGIGDTALADATVKHFEKLMHIEGADDKFYIDAKLPKAEVAR